jgi:sulfate adenylyltransferase subunit 2
MILYHLNHLRELEAEAIYVIREAASQFERPAMLFSGGKDSIVMTHLARKAFYPAQNPISIACTLTRATTFRKQSPSEMKLLRTNRSDADCYVMCRTPSTSGRAKEEKGPNASRNMLQTITLT